MKTSVKKILVLEGIIALLTILNFFIPNIYSSNKYLILLALSLLYLNIFVGININRNSNDKIVIRNILIYIISYYLIIYMFGLVVGFAKSIYSISISNLMKNIIPSILTICAVELIRYTIISKSSKDKLVSITSCILFILLEVSISYKAYNFAIKDDVYLFVGLLIASSITKNILMTLIMHKTDYLPAMLYRFCLETIEFVLLIIPNLGPYLKSVIAILFPVLVGMMIINFEEKRVKEKPKVKNKKSIAYLIVVAILLILILLNSGLLKYQIMVIGSNSMKNYMEKGDLIFVERLRNDNRKTVKKNEILVYKYDQKIISHRVSERIERQNEVYYRTKGDANNQEDGIIIEKEDVMGKVLFRIKYLGLPSVWLSELFD